LIVGSAPPQRAGAAAAISETGSEFGGALGIAILGSLGTAVYRSRMADAIPAGVPRGVTDTALDTLGGAVAAAQQLPHPVGAQLVTAARDAFTTGLQLAAATSALVAIGVAVLVVVLLGRLRTGSDSGAHPDATSVA
jgi:DHA2 family multidrug resistance protein-like MFS transporter